MKNNTDDTTARRLQRYLHDIAQKYPNLWKKVDYVRAARGTGAPSWPAWCFMPLGGAYAIASFGRDETPPQNLSEVGIIGALAAWRVTQGIYRYDATVLEALRDTPLTGNIPGEILRALPEWCVYVETPGWTWHDVSAYGFFCYLESDANSKREELRFLIECAHGLEAAMPIHLGADLETGLRWAYEEGVRLWKTKERPSADQLALIAQAEEGLRAAVDDLAVNLAPMVSVILYLCSINAEIRPARDTGKLRPWKPNPVKTKDGLRMFPADKPVMWDVGSRIGAAIRRAGEQQWSKPQDGTHASPRPHIRRAHWHSFWTGPKAKVGQLPPPERKLVVKWLPPMEINIDDELEPIPTVHRVLG